MGLPLIAAAIPGLISAAGSGIGYQMGADDRAAAEAAQEEALARMMGVSVPQLQELKLKEYGTTQIYTPEEEQAIALGKSQVGQIEIDPYYKDVQMAGLRKLQEDIDAAGLSPETQANLNIARREESRMTRGKEASILENMQARGMGGGPAELAARMAAAQAGSERMAQAADREAVMGKQIKMQALAQAAQQASGMQQSEFGRELAKKQADDAFRQFDVSNQIGVQQRNIAARNRALEDKYRDEQYVNRANVGLSHEEQKNAQDIAQRQYGMNLGLSQAQAGAKKDYATHKSGQAKETGGMVSSIASGVGGATGALAGAGAFDGLSFGGDSNPESDKWSEWAKKA